MQESQLDPKQVAALQRAIHENPQRVRTEVGKFLVRGIAAYNRVIIRNPWRVGMTGGGAPVRTGNLRDTHLRQIDAFEARIGPDAELGGKAPYAAYVHGIEGHPRKRAYALRPWLDYAFATADNEIRELEAGLLDTIVRGLADA